MKALGLNPKKLIIALCILVVGIFGLALLIVTFIYPIEGMRVYVVVPTNAPSWVLAEAATNSSMKSAATANWTTEIPFNDAANKFISETDIAQIKHATPWNKTILHLYWPEKIVVESPTEAYAQFSRQHIRLAVFLKKRDGIWEAESVSTFAWEESRPLNFKERIAESLPR